MSATGPPTPLGTPPPAPASVRPSAWFWPNLVLLAILAPFATWWFQQHLQLYFTEVVLIGGGLTLWAFLRAGYGLIEKVGKVDPAAMSRRALGSPEATLLLLVAAAAMAGLWLKSNSFYLEYAGGASGDKEFVVQVTRAADGAPFIPDAAVGPATKVAGQVFFFRGEPAELSCRIVKPLRYEPLLCPIGATEAKRVKVPEDFTPRAFHLLRIVPAPALFDELPKSGDPVDYRYQLEVATDGASFALPDWRRQTVFAGAKGADMPFVLALQDRQEYEQYLGSSLRAMGVSAESSSSTAAVLVLRTKTWDAFDAKAGKRLRFSLRRIEQRDGQVQASVVEGFPQEYTVTADKVQTIWLPKLP